MTINETIIMGLRVGEHSNVPMFFIGNPGTGKTTSVEYFAKMTNREMILLRGSQSSPEEILGYEVNMEETYPKGHPKEGQLMKSTSKLRPKWYMRLMDFHEKGIGTILFLDEITAASQYVQAALLQVIFGKAIDDENKIPDSCLIVAAGNYASNLSSEFNLIPPLMNRFCIINIVPGKEDLKSFLSKYQPGKDLMANLRGFDATVADDSSIDDSFRSLVKHVFEKDLANFVIDLIDKGNYDPTITDMSDIYQDQESIILPGFITFRTLNYFRDVTISTYLLYGSSGIKSSAYQRMTEGLVGISLYLDSNGRNGSATPSRKNMTNEFVQFSKSTAAVLDKKKITSINEAEMGIRRIITKLNTKGELTTTSVVDSPSLNAIEKILSTSSTNRELKTVKTPIDVKLIMEVGNVIISTAKNVLSEDIDDIKKLLDSSSKESSVNINVERINGNIKHYNDSIEAYKALKSFINVPEFSYDGDIRREINEKFKEILVSNKYKIDFVKNNLSKKLGISMSELVETSKF